MANYKKLYHKTFNAITDAERLIAEASEMLKTIQQECEENIIFTDESDLCIDKK